MRISPLTETRVETLERLASVVHKGCIRAHVNTTELSMMLGVSQDTIKRRLNRERERSALLDTANFTWDTSHLPEPAPNTWRTRPAEWDLVVVLRWLAQRPMRRQV